MHSGKENWSTVNEVYYSLKQMSELIIIKSAEFYTYYGEMEGTAVQ